MSTRAEFFQSMYPGLSDGEVIDELIKASIYGFEHGPEVVTISAAEGIHYVPYNAEMQKKLPYYGGAYEACNIPFTDFQIRYQPEQIRIVDGKRILEDTAFLCRAFMRSWTWMTGFWHTCFSTTKTENGISVWNCRRLSDAICLWIYAV